MTAAIIILLFLFLVNGILVMAEIALVSARKTKLDLDARKGDKRSQLALENANDPSRILSTIQIGITLIGILTGVYSSDALSHSLAEWFNHMGLDLGVSHSLALAIVVMIVTFVSMLFGELVPKRIGLINPEGISRTLVGPLLALSYISYPFTWVLSRAGDGILHLLKIKPSAESKVTEEEIKAMVQEGAEDGEVQEIEQDIVARVFHLGDRKISSLMTHHSDLVWLDIHETTEEMQAKMQQQLHSVYPVCEDDLDNVVGVIFIKDLFLENLCDEKFRIIDRIKPAQYVLETQTAYETLETFKQNKIHYGL
ncbi:MAG: hemolysin family protein, partial [Bacteroidota bacterium]